MSLDTFDPSLLGDWTKVPGFINGEHVATAFLNGNEVHFVIDAPWRNKAIQKDRLLAFVDELLRTAGFLTTRIKKDRTTQIRFVTRLGFRKTWTDGTFDYFFLGSISKGTLHDSLRT